jgi:hypothetical protein
MMRARTGRPPPTGVAMATVAAFCLGASACESQGAAAASSAPRAIAGGRFESSGVAHVPGSNAVLFVDDGRTREIFMMELSAQGAQQGKAVAVPLGADVTDPEGITSDGRHFYVVGSQSKGNGFEGDGLVRFTFDHAQRRVLNVERIPGLKAWLAANVPELRGTAGRVGDDVFNIEAIAWDPAGARLLLGFRAPVVGGHALVVPIRLIDAKAGFTRENLRVDGAAIRLDLGGAGIRSLEYDAQEQAYQVIAGSGVNDENQDFRLLHWDGKAGSMPREVASYSRRLKPEGIVRATLGGRSVRVIVFDVGRFQVLN